MTEQGNAKERGIWEYSWAISTTAFSSLPSWLTTPYNQVMIPVATAFAVVVSCLSAAGASPPQIAFERGAAIWIANVDGTSARKIGRGSGPDLSPDGTKIAFHTDRASQKSLVRQIAMVDVATKRVTVFRKEIPSENCQHARWSPDGSKILFHIWTESDWHIAMINRDGSGFRYVRKAAPNYNSYWSTCWAGDGKSFYAQDLTYLYQFDLDGKDLQKWKLDSLFPKGSMNSGSSISMAPGGRKLLLDIDMDEEEANLPDWEGPPPALWTLDLDTKKATRITPKGKIAIEGCWLDDSQILFVAQSAKEKNLTVYQMALGDKGWKSILKDASGPSVSQLSAH
ncbi:MAG: TolB family protein [Chthoniobacterales bacterium]